MTDKWSAQAKHYLAQLYDESPEKALEFASDMNYSIETGEMYELGKKYPIMGGVISVATNLGNMLEYPLNLAEYAGQKIKGVANAELRRSTSADITAALRSGGANNEIISSFKIGDWNAGGFVYNGLLSLADMMVVRGMGSGGAKIATKLTSKLGTGKVVKWVNKFLGNLLGGSVLGTSAAASATNDVLDRGGTAEQAIHTGTAAFFIETLTETFSLSELDMLKDTGAAGIKAALEAGGKGKWAKILGQTAKSVGISMGTNASEEYFSEVANILYDTLANGDISQFSTQVRNYMAEGMSEEEARKKVAVDFAYQTLEAAASGAFIGLLSGGGDAALNYVSENAAYKKLNRENLSLYGSDASELVAEGLSAPEGSKSRVLAEQLQAKLDSGQQLTGADITAMITANEKQFKANDTAKINLAVKKRLTALGESSNVDVLSSAITKQIIGEKLTKSEQNIISNSTYGKRVLNEAATDNIQSGDYSSSWAESIGTDRINADVYNMNSEVDGIDGSSESGYNNTVNGANIGGNVNGSTNTELLAGGKVSAVGGSNNSVREQGGNTEKLAGYLGVLGTTKRNISQKYRAGESGGLLQKDNSQSGKARRIESLLRALSGINLSGKDTIGRIISPEVAEKFKSTVFKDENGNLLSLYHWTTATFEKFAKGEFGFHFGTLDAAHDRYMQTKEDNPDTPIGTYKEVYLNITNPISLNEGIGQWTAGWVAFQLKEKGIISQQELDRLEETKGFYDNSYDNPAANAVREILKQNRYDGIIYENDSEDKGSISVIALYPDQIITVAENGILKENSGVSEADLDDKSAFSMDENAVSQSGAKGITEPDISKDTRSHEERVAEMMGGKESQKVKGRKFVQSIGKALGVTVVFEDTVEKYGEWSDGYIDKNGVIHIDYNNKNPLAFLFRHEMVHYGSGSKFYKQFVKLVYNSKLFREWLQEKTKMPAGTSVDRMAAKYMTMVAESRKGVEELSETGLQEEMVADFAGSDLFTAGGSGLAAMSTEFDTKQRNVVSQYIADLISWIKKKINKVPGAENLTFELSRLEDTFNRMISDAKQNPTERELKHSIAGIRAKTANLIELWQAKKGIYKDNSETVRKNTGWWQGKDGKWRFYIPDNEMGFYPAGLVENPETLGDFLKHDKLFAAYPELKDIKLSFKKMKKSIKGSYNPDTNIITLNEMFLNDEELMKDTLIHEIQHAIQVIEGFALGGNESLSQRYAFNVAYNDVKNTEEFKNLKSSDEKRNYVISSAIKMVGAKNEQDLYHKVYEAIYGEEEARYAEKFRYFDDDLLKLLTPAYSGYIIDAEQETQKFIDNLKEIGYTESEIEALYGGDPNDKSGSNSYHATAHSRINDSDGLSADNIVMSGIRNFRNESEGKGRPDILGQGVSSEVSDRQLRRLEENQAELNNSAFSMPENIRRSVPVDTDTDTDTDIDNDIIADFQKLNNEFNKGNIEEETYMQQVAELYEEIVKKNGRIKPGEVGKTKYQDIPVPKKIDKKTKVQRHVRTILEGGELTDEMVGTVKEKILSGNLNYTPVSNKKNIAYAEDAVMKGAAVGLWERAINSDGLPNAKDIAIGEVLLKLAVERGNAAEVVKYTAELAELGTRLGQSVQALSTLKRMDGVGQLIYVKRAVDSLNRDLSKRFKGKAPIVQIDENMALRLAESKTAEDFEITYSAIMNDIAAQVPVTFLDKWNALRYFAMLSNPKTHIRNVVGNAIFVPAVRIRYFLAAVGEQALSQDQRTKSVVIKKEYKDFAKKDATSQEVINLLKGNKYNDKTALREKQRIFKSNALEFLTRFNSDALEAEDMLFKNKHYIHAFAGFLQARNVDLNNVSQDVIDEARNYAVEEAKKATFTDESALANWIQNFGNKNLLTNMMVAEHKGTVLSCGTQGDGSLGNTRGREHKGTVLSC